VPFSAAYLLHILLLSGLACVRSDTLLFSELSLYSVYADLCLAFPGVPPCYSLLTGAVLAARCEEPTDLPLLLGRGRAGGGLQRRSRARTCHPREGCRVRPRQVHVTNARGGWERGCRGQASRRGVGPGGRTGVVGRGRLWVGFLPVGRPRPRRVLWVVP